MSTTQIAIIEQIPQLPQKEQEIIITWANRGLELNEAANKAYSLIDACEAFVIPDVSNLNNLSEEELKPRLEIIPTLRDNIKTMKGWAKEIDAIMEPSLEIMTAVVDKLRAPGKSMLNSRTDKGKKIEEGIIADHEFALLQLEKKSTELADIIPRREKIISDHRLNIIEQYNTAIANLEKDMAYEISEAYKNALKNIEVKNIDAHIAWLATRHIWALPVAPKNDNPLLQKVNNEVWLTWDNVNLNFATDLRTKFADFKNDKANYEAALQKNEAELASKVENIEVTQSDNTFAQQMHVHSVPLGMNLGGNGTKKVYKLDVGAMTMTPELLQTLISAVFANKAAAFGVNRTGLMTIATPFITMLESLKNEDNGFTIQGLNFVETLKLRK